MLPKGLADRGTTKKETGTGTATGIGTGETEIGTATGKGIETATEIGIGTATATTGIETTGGATRTGMTARGRAVGLANDERQLLLDLLHPLLKLLLLPHRHLKMKR